MTIRELEMRLFTLQERLTRVDNMLAIVQSDKFLITSPDVQGTVVIEQDSEANELVKDALHAASAAYRKEYVSLYNKKNAIEELLSN